MKLHCCISVGVVLRVLYAEDLQFRKEYLVFFLVKGALILCPDSRVAFCTRTMLCVHICNVLCVHAVTTNNVLRLSVVNVSSPADAQLLCIFLSGFTGAAHCTVQYGTDPTYINLPYSAESTETGTVGDTVSVVLRDRLNSLTVYYYTVSAVSGDVTVRVQGSFMTPQSSICACTCQCALKF